jgi:hypothetical protein
MFTGIYSKYIKNTQHCLHKIKQRRMQKYKYNMVSIGNTKLPLITGMVDSSWMKRSTRQSHTPVVCPSPLFSEMKIQHK